MVAFRKDFYDVFGLVFDRKTLLQKRIGLLHFCQHLIAFKRKAEQFAYSRVLQWHLQGQVIVWATESVEQDSLPPVSYELLQLLLLLGDCAFVNDVGHGLQLILIVAKAKHDRCYQQHQTARSDHSPVGGFDFSLKMLWQKLLQLADLLDLELGLEVGKGKEGGRHQQEGHVEAVHGQHHYNKPVGDYFSLLHREVFLAEKVAHQDNQSALHQVLRIQHVLSILVLFDCLEHKQGSARKNPAHRLKQEGEASVLKVQKKHHDRNHAVQGDPGLADLTCLGFAVGGDVSLDFWVGRVQGKEIQLKIRIFMVSISLYEKFESIAHLL